MGKFIVIFICLAIAYVIANENDEQQPSEQTTPKLVVTECLEFPGVGILKVNETRPVAGTCNIATCHEDGSISEKTCASGIANPPCKILPGDETELYPKCCPKYWCPPEEETPSN